MNDSEIRRLVFQQSKSAYREIAALKDEIAKRDAEIALLSKLVDAHSIDLATKEYSPSIEAVRGMIANNVDDVAKSLERNGLYIRLSRMSKAEEETAPCASCGAMHAPKVRTGDQFGSADRKEKHEIQT